MQEELNVTNVNQAINVLIQGVNLAQSKGVYSFNDSVVIKSALDFLESQTKQPESTETPQEMEVVDTTAE
jgi:hypothetical protein